MSKFETNYKREVSYSQSVRVDVNLDTRPSQEDYQKILDAMEILGKIADTYIKEPKPIEKPKE